MKQKNTTKLNKEKLKKRIKKNTYAEQYLQPTKNLANQLAKEQQLETEIQQFQTSSSEEDQFFTKDDLHSQAQIKGQVWEDNNDNQINIDLSKVARLRKLRKNESETLISGKEYQKRLQDFYSTKLSNLDFYKWGNQQQQLQTNKANDDTFLEKLLKTDYDRIMKFKKGLENNIISVEKVGNILKKDKENGVVQTLNFHKSNEIVLAGGLTKILSLFRISENDEDNELKSLDLSKKVYLENFPILQANFIQKNNKIIASGMRRHLLVYEIEKDYVEKISSSFVTEKFQSKFIEKFQISPNEDQFAIYNKNGDIVMLSESTKQYIFDLKMNQACTSVQFSTDNNYLFACGERGKIYEWDLRMRLPLDCFADKGSPVTTSMKVTENYMATGSSTGIVNIYGKQSSNLNEQKFQFNSVPLKEIQNITTSVKGVEINEQEEILAIYSQWKKNNLRLIHLPSLTVYQNWPNFRTKISYVQSLAFSKNSKYLAIGNEFGDIYLYNFKHYN